MRLVRAGEMRSHAVLASSPPMPAWRESAILCGGWFIPRRRRRSWSISTAAAGEDPREPARLADRLLFAEPVWGRVGRPSTPSAPSRTRSGTSPARLAGLPVWK